MMTNVAKTIRPLVKKGFMTYEEMRNYTLIVYHPSALQGSRPRATIVLTSEYSTMVVH